MKRRKKSLVGWANLNWKSEMAISKITHMTYIPIITDIKDKDFCKKVRITITEL